MNIGIVAQNVDLSNPGFSAAATKLQEQVRILAELGHNVTLVTQNSKNLKFNFPKNTTIYCPSRNPTTFYTLGRVFRSLFTEKLAVDVFKKLASKNALDIIFQRVQVGSFIGPMFFSKYHIPCIAECNSWWSDGLSALYPWTRFIPNFKQIITRNVIQYLKRCQRVIAVSKGLRDRLISHGIPRSKIDVVDNGARNVTLEDQKTSETLKKHYAIEEKFVIGYVCSFGPKHALNRILDSAKILSHIRQDFIFMVVGSGSRVNEFQKKIRQNNLEDYFLLPGWTRYDLYPHILLFDIALLVYNRITESSGLSPVKLFEYMACACPILVDDFAKTDTHRLITHKETGIFLPTDSADQLADNVEYLLNNSEIRKILGKNALQQFKEHYTWEKNVQRILESIKKVY